MMEHKSFPSPIWQPDDLERDSAVPAVESARPELLTNGWTNSFSGWVPRLCR